MLPSKDRDSTVEGFGMMINLPEIVTSKCIEMITYHLIYYPFIIVTSQHLHTFHSWFFGGSGPVGQEKFGSCSYGKQFGALGDHPPKMKDDKPNRVWYMIMIVCVYDYIYYNYIIYDTCSTNYV